MLCKSLLRYEAVLGQELSEDERDYFMEALLQAKQALGEI